MRKDIVVNLDFFDSNKFSHLSSQEFSVLLYILSEERVFNTQIEIHVNQLIEKGLFEESNENAKKEIKRVVNKLHNKRAIRFLGSVNDCYTFELMEIPIDNQRFISVENYINTRNQLNDHFHIYLYHYISINASGNKSFKVFSYHQLSKTMQKTLSECQQAVEYLVENGLLIAQDVKNKNTNKVQEISEFRELERNYE